MTQPTQAVLVLNVGSSSIKYQLLELDPDDQTRTVPTDGRKRARDRARRSDRRRGRGHADAQTSLTRLATPSPTR
jgi:acetate kinase